MSLRLVIVDDDKVVIFLHNLVVKKGSLSMDPLAFTGGKEALDYLHNHHQEDITYLILLDINMPEMSGWEFLDIIQDMPYANAVSVIMVTSSIDAKDKERAKAYKQVIDFIEKPLNIDTCNRIKRLPQIAHFFS